MSKLQTKQNVSSVPLTIMIKGPRQSGKTTILLAIKKILQKLGNKVYIESFNPSCKRAVLDADKRLTLEELLNLIHLNKNDIIIEEIDH